MNRCYKDILDKIKEEPIWFDENAVPRYCPFHPDELDIYANEAALIEIECQHCQHSFNVAISRYHLADSPTIKDMIERHTIGYGDPPNVGCCSGVASTSNTIRIIEYWENICLTNEEGIVIKPYRDWTRHPELEITIEDSDE